MGADIGLKEVLTMKGTRWPKYRISKLGSNDLGVMRQLLALYSEVFDDPDTYGSKPPSDDYLRRLLGKDQFISLVATVDNHVVGGLSAYVLEKFEQERSEVYIYDLAVKEDFRRRGIATGLIRRVQELASEGSSWVIFVQADHGDEPAIKLYESMGVREEVLHFDIPVRK